MYAFLFLNCPPRYPSAIMARRCLLLPGSNEKATPVNFGTCFHWLVNYADHKHKSVREIVIVGRSATFMYNPWWVNIFDVQYRGRYNIIEEVWTISWWVPLQSRTINSTLLITPSYCIPCILFARACTVFRLPMLAPGALPITAFPLVATIAVR